LLFSWHCPGVLRANTRSLVSAKEPYISTKEPCISAKEPYIFCGYKGSPADARADSRDMQGSFSHMKALLWIRRALFRILRLFCGYAGLFFEYEGSFADTQGSFFEYEGSFADTQGSFFEYEGSFADTQGPFFEYEGSFADA
jgi:hypothetical protein